MGDSSTTLYAPGEVSLVPVTRKSGSPIPVSAVPEWLAGLLADLPKSSEFRAILWLISLGLDHIRIDQKGRQFGNA